MLIAVIAAIIGSIVVSLIVLPLRAWLVMLAFGLAADVFNIPALAIGFWGAAVLVLIAILLFPTNAQASK